MEKIIKVKNLKKDFRFGVKDPEKGFWGNLFSKKTKTVRAVDNISFDVGRGESLAFIGPNGAGKSTTIKMLTGILTQSRGDIEVAGFSPAVERQKLTYKIGTVFGQRSQLVFNLPMPRSFDLFGAVYGVDASDLKKRVEKLVGDFRFGCNCLAACSEVIFGTADEGGNCISAST